MFAARGRQQYQQLLSLEPCALSHSHSVLLIEMVGRSVTASFGHYDVSGTTYVVPDLHAKIGHVDPELSCRQK